MLERIKNVTSEEMDELLPAVLDRYREEQIDRIKEFPDKMKIEN